MYVKKSSGDLELSVLSLTLPYKSSRRMVTVDFSRETELVLVVVTFTSLCIAT